MGVGWDEGGGKGEGSVGVRGAAWKRMGDVAWVSR
jgi:hypothetical protein